MRTSIRSSVISALLLAATALAPSMAQAQSISGVPLSPIIQARGPFKQVVVGASVVRPNATVAPAADAVVNIADGSLPAFGGLFWWGSTLDGQPDRAVTITLPNGAVLTLNANDPTANDPTGSAQNPFDPDQFEDDDDPCFTIVADDTTTVGTEQFFFQCALNITDALAELPTLDGAYTFAGLTPNVAAPHNSPCGNGSQACSVYVGAFALAMLYVDPNDLASRVVQIANGLVFTQFFGDDASIPLLPFEMSDNGGQATIVAFEGDVEFPGANACNGTIDDTTDSSGVNEGLPQCDFLAFCEGTCISNLNVLQLTQADVVTTLVNNTNPVGNVFNETVSTEFGAEVTGVVGDELNSLDIDTFNLQGRLPDGLYPDLVVGIQSGGDAVLLGLVAVSIEDFDRDGDGLSNIQEEDEIGTNPNDPDTDGDGIRDGAEVFGGNPADPRSNPTNPLDSDSDNDGLCDGSGADAVTGVRALGCQGGEDVNNDGLRDANETNPNDADSDDDLLSDGLEVLTGNYGAEGAAGTVDADGGRAGRQTSPLNPDTDGDGLDDGEEDADRDGTFDPQNNETDPTDFDTDDGGEGDGSERGNGRDPVDFPLDDNGNLGNDNDGDGLANGQEDANNNGQVDPGETDQNDPDTDGDGLADGVEDADRDADPADRGTTETSPVNPDTDGDGLCDGATAVQGAGGACIAGEDLDTDADPSDRGTTETDPLDPDTDGDGITDGTEVQSEYPGPVDANPNRPGSQTNPLNPDSDGDGLGDGVEDVNKDGRLQGGESDPTDPQDPNAGEGEGEGEGEGDADPDGDGGDFTVDEEEPKEEIEKFIAGSALYACANVGGAGAPMVGLLALLGLLQRRRRL